MHGHSIGKMHVPLCSTVPLGQAQPDSHEDAATWFFDLHVAGDTGTQSTYTFPPIQSVRRVFAK